MDTEERTRMGVFYRGHRARHWRTTDFQSSISMPITMSTALSCFVEPPTGGIGPPGATRNAACFARIGEREPFIAAGV